MPINVFGNSSNNSDNKIDTSLFVQKPYLRTNYIEANIEEDINLKNQSRIKNLPDPISIQEAASKNYVDNMVDESSLLRLDPNETLDLENQDSIILNSSLTSSKTIIELPTKAYIDSLHEENKRSRRDLRIDFYNESIDLVKNNQDNDFNDNKLTNINSIEINNSPSVDSQVSNEKYVDDQLDKNAVVRFNQTLQNYLKVSVGNDTYNLAKYNKTILVDETHIRYLNTGSDLLQKWRIRCNNKFGNSRVSDFVKSTKTNSPTGYSGATSLPPIGSAFMFFEVHTHNHGDNKCFVSIERTDIIQISNITFYYNRHSYMTDETKKNMGRLRIQLLLDDSNGTTLCTIERDTDLHQNSTDWSLLNLDFTVKNFGIKLVYDRIFTAHADMCFSDITITHSVY